MTAQDIKDHSPKFIVMVKDASDTFTLTNQGVSYWYFTAPTLKVAIQRMKQQQLPNREMKLFNIDLTSVVQ